MPIINVRASRRVRPTYEQHKRNVQVIADQAGKVFYIYQIGGHWMYTGATFEQCQAKYKLKVRNWEKVSPQNVY